ncbi:hypothetical protein BSKO_12610 [Bryopsis sp. KO-2023]|nr:hypothetical protein BSKO_12610 [Bryopsis sp. KO-2023]
MLVRSWTQDAIPRDAVGIISKFVPNLEMMLIAFLVVDLIWVIYVACQSAFLEKALKRELEKMKLLRSKADEYLMEEDLKDGRELHKQMAELKTVRKKVRRLLARNRVLLQEIKEKQRRMELQLAGREMKRRIQAFDRQNAGNEN